MGNGRNILLAPVVTWDLGNNISIFLSSCVNVSPCTLVKPAPRSVMLVGSCTAWNTAFNPTVKCRPTKPSEEEMIHSIPSSARLEQESTSLELCLLTWNPQLLMRSEREPTVSCSILSN